MTDSNFAPSTNSCDADVQILSVIFCRAVDILESEKFAGVHEFCNNYLLFELKCCLEIIFHTENLNTFVREISVEAFDQILAMLLDIQWREYERMVRPYLIHLLSFA